MYKVFVNQYVIVLTNKVQFGTKITVLPLKETSLSDIFKKIKKRKTIFLYHHNPNKLISHFKKKLKLVRAGGGIVKNSKDETLFIYRRSKWDLPKGKKDKGESIEETALREVEEETGLQIEINIDLMTVAELKESLRDLGLKVSGRKADLQARLKAAIE